MLDKLKNTKNGPVISKAKVQIIFWGAEWSSATQKQSALDLTSQLVQLFAGPYMRGLIQYGVSVAGVVDSPTFDATSIPPPTISISAIGQYLQSAIGNNGILDFRNDDQILYLVVTLNRSWDDPNVGGFHYWDKLGGKTFHWAWIVSPSSGFASHEIIEACTDPEATSWLQPENGIEVGDICEDSGGIEPADGVEAAVYWSNLDGMCILPSRTATLRGVDATGDNCVGPHVGGRTLFTVNFGVEPSWIDSTGLSLTNPKFAWTFNSTFASAVGPTDGPSLELLWNEAIGPQAVSVTVTADVGIVLSAEVVIQSVLNAQETEIVERMCEFRRIIETTALLPPPPPDPEGPIIATLLPTPSEINRLAGLVARLDETLSRLAELNSVRPMYSGRMPTTG